MSAMAGPVRSGTKIALLAGLLVAGLVIAGPMQRAKASVDIVVSRVTGASGRDYWVENHLVRSDPAGVSTANLAPAVPGSVGQEYLIVWAGDENIADSMGPDIAEKAASYLPAPDFLAVIDADRRSASYGKVVNTVTVGPLEENEPHHMQYLYHKGDRVFAGGLFTDTTYVFDVSKLPLVTLAGVTEPQDTPCGSVPDAYWTLKDHTAYGTYMGGADIPGPCRYTNGEVRSSNGYGGSPGSLVHIAADGRVLSEVPAALPTSEDPTRCPNYPPIAGQATCANPHGIQVREDLNRIVASDYAEPRNIVLAPVTPWDPNIFRPTVRVFDNTDENNPELASVSVMPDGPRPQSKALGRPGGMPAVNTKWGIMETTVTNLPQHRGAFASSMCGGVLYYTPDMTAAEPVWREVFDDTTAARVINPKLTAIAGCDGAGWAQTSPDDRFLYHTVIGRNAGAFGPSDLGVPKMVYVLDISKLVAAGTSTACSIDTITEVWQGGTEPDCPRLTSVLGLSDGTSGGPHWGAMDNFVQLPSGQFTETTKIRRLAVSNYFVARSSLDGDHKVCMADLSPTGKLTLDTTFRDENQGTPCVDFNRSDWPHGPYGNAKPHSELFVVPDNSLR